MLTLTHLAQSSFPERKITWATLNICVYYHCFAFETAWFLLGENCGYITFLSPPTLSLYVSSCLWRSQPLQPTGRRLQSSNLQAFFFVWLGMLKTRLSAFLMCLQWRRQVFLTGTLCLIGTDSYGGSDTRKNHSAYATHQCCLVKLILQTKFLSARLQTGTGVDGISANFKESWNIPANLQSGRDNWFGSVLHRLQ